MICSVVLMITLAVDNFQPGNGRLLPNGLTPEQCVNDDFATKSPWLDYPRLYYYLKESKIAVQVKQTAEANTNDWYPVTIGWFDFTQDYFELINPLVIKKGLKIVFLYHEADNPKDINARLEELADLHNYDNIAFISGNSAADQYHFTHYWPELEYMYRRSVDFTKASLTQYNRRSKHFTALCRIDKLWRKVFMSNLWHKNLHLNGYFSYCQEFLGEQDDWDGVPLLNEFLTSQQPIWEDFIKAGPFYVDELTTTQRNDYSILMDDMYNDSYFNIVLETFIDVDSSGGQFITEKTLKPILHCQPFICVAEAYHLEHLRSLGYHTFERVFDESYDKVEDTQERFEMVMSLSQELAEMDLDSMHNLYKSVGDITMWNRIVLENNIRHRLKDLITKIST